MLNLSYRLRCHQPRSSCFVIPFVLSFCLFHTWMKPYPLYTRFFGSLLGSNFDVYDKNELNLSISSILISTLRVVYARLMRKIATISIITLMIKKVLTTVLIYLDSSKHIRLSGMPLVFGGMGTRESSHLSM